MYSITFCRPDGTNFIFNFTKIAITVKNNIAIHAAIMEFVIGQEPIKNIGSEASEICSI